MPTYSYKCPKCNNAVELMATMANRDKQYCPKCNVKYTRQVAAPALVGFDGLGRSK